MDFKFSSSQVVELTGITPRQLQWWDERGIVKPAREGHRRLYSFEDVAEISVIVELRRRGFSLQRVRKVMRWLQRELGQTLLATTSANSQIHLLLDGNRIFLEDSEHGVLEVLKNSRQPLLAVCLSDAVQRVRSEMSFGSAPRRQTARVQRKTVQKHPPEYAPRERGSRMDVRSAVRAKRSGRRVRSAASSGSIL